MAGQKPLTTPLPPGEGQGEGALGFGYPRLSCIRASWRSSIEG
ncbi:Uncharacterised protein [Pseudomonas fragi]|uniref:Uncharacterized protein n=1 Tax=Pseudomonas fragi TaxID=296 RepID=A0A449IN40_PSEFR|nr:Uncharacterised protein [Pseudomonas fragi]